MPSKDKNMSEKTLFKTQIRIRRYVSLLITDEFNHWVLEQRRLEQSKNRPKPQKWSNLNVTRTEIWLSGTVWWPGSVIKSIQLMEVRGLVTFHAVPALLAMGIQSRFNPSNKQYVVMFLPSGKHRDKLIKVLQPMCDPQHRVSQCDIQTDTGQGTSSTGYRLSDTSRIELGLYKGEDVGSAWSVSTDHESTKQHTDETASVGISRSKPPKIIVEKSETPVDNVRAVTLTKSVPLQSRVRTPSTMSPSTSTSSSPLLLPSPVVRSTAPKPPTLPPQPPPPPALVPEIMPRKICLQAETEYTPGLDETQMTYVYNDPKLGAMICKRGPVYLYCEHYFPDVKM
ncbi:hypothetical protein FGIG_08820 [Fasciola gigantica]|uniref:Uncharacterized protein n=1 Tax=Fasciola gigantica TaxID=46835 RepID=A0A504YRH6_FASGI|nr:hypothetical protein FGIG_08820 [Fasciola gigantica]